MGAIVSLLVAQLFLFIAIFTPAWQVAFDTDAQRYVQSGLWMYCQTGAQCWYIFSDNLINYYEKAYICRFLLIYDCRHKLLRTPYFFGWHYAVFVLTLIALGFSAVALVAILFSLFKFHRLRILVIIYIAASFVSFLVLSVGLSVFVINAEMLESRFLIGIKNTFEKSYGYSIYLASFANLFFLVALLVGVVLITFVFFSKTPEIWHEVNGSEYEPPNSEARIKGSRMSQFAIDDDRSFEGMRSVTPVSQLHSSQLGTPMYGQPGQPFQQTTRHFYSY